MILRLVILRDVKEISLSAQRFTIRSKVRSDYPRFPCTTLFHQGSFKQSLIELRGAALHGQPLRVTYCRVAGIKRLLKQSPISRESESTNDIAYSLQRYS